MKVTTSSATLRWEPPTKLPDYDTLNYKLVYWQADSEGEEVEVSVEDVHYELTGLIMATTYVAKVKVFGPTWNNVHFQLLILGGN
jgi:hypothetical protein